MEWPVGLHVLRALLLLTAGIPAIILYFDHIAEKHDGKRAYIESEVAASLLAILCLISIYALVILKFSTIDQLLIKAFWN